MELLSKILFQVTFEKITCAKKEKNLLRRKILAHRVNIYNDSSLIKSPL